MHKVVMYLLQYVTDQPAELPPDDYTDERVCMARQIDPRVTEEAAVAYLQIADSARCGTSTRMAYRQHACRTNEQHMQIIFISSKYLNPLLLFFFLVL